MGSRFNVFFADAYDDEINDVKLFKQKMKSVLKLAVTNCIGKMEERDKVEYPDEEFEFEGYSGDIASGDPELLYCDEEFTITDEQIGVLEDGNDDWGFPYDDEWFVPIRTLLEKKCKKWGPSLCVKINARWAIMGFYSD